jgi:2-C-methyl-D-erythritol 4-phosphate cytidylyltransferase/2-C-methyl-D-erythritol 2,4-cyclodiphosphate synthase
LSAAAPEPADAVVVAAGASRRMGGIDKLDHVVAGRPLLAWSVAALAAVDAVERIVVVVAPDRRSEIASAEWLGSRVVDVVPGGSRRHESVAAGLAALDAIDRNGGGPRGPGPPATDVDRVVLVHDGARPLASPSLVGAVLDAAARHGAAIPVLPLAETVKRVAGDVVVETLDRSVLATAQTPQAARRSLLREAFARFPPTGPETWTDEAALLEACRIAVHAIPGDPANLKVTLLGDLATVDAALAPESAAGLRVGFGADSHPFGPGGPLALGGITIAEGLRLAGHSDGDVVLHAVADALLGAGAIGDLGRLFPAGPETPAGISSRDLLAAVVERLRSAGHVPVSVDVTIVGARPRLGAHLDAMRDAIGEILALPHGAVNVKASTGNLDGMEGAGRGISAHAVASVARAG